jgi:hypothetical protein
MNTRILENPEGQSLAQSGARMLTEQEMDAIAGGGLIYCAEGRTVYVNEDETSSMFHDDRAKYEKYAKELEDYKARGCKVGTIVMSLFSVTKYADVPPAMLGTQGYSGG